MQTEKDILTGFYTPATKYSGLTISSDMLTSPTFKLPDSAIEDILKALNERYSKVPTIEHKCHNCGGVLELAENQHIFHCPYCNSVYAVGIHQIHDRG